MAAMWCRAGLELSANSCRPGRPLSGESHLSQPVQQVSRATATLVEDKGVGISQTSRRRTSRDASARPIRTTRGGVEYAPIVQRAAAIIGSAIFLVIAPGTLAVYVPWYLTHWHFAPPLFPIARVLGAALIVAGLPILLDSFARFALQGLGTPAPVMPPKRLVVTGFYRYVRNPMYVAVTALIAGQGLLFGSVTVLEYGAILWAGFFLFVVAYEEPALGEQFADEYKRYRANVRRWLPRITPWRG